MGYYDAFDDFMGSWTEYADKPRSKDRKQSKRTTQYVGPGHTRVRYAHRTLNIRFKETPAQFKAKQRSRRRAGARKGAKNRPRRSTRNDEIYVDFINGEMVYVDSKGRDVSLKAMGYADKGMDTIIKKNLKSDKYTVEDMRALLRDAHWEEICGNKRWSYDSKATVKEFNKYQRKYGNMR